MNSLFKKNLFKFGLIIGVFLFLAFGMRALFFEAINVFSEKVILGQAQSPNRKYVLSVYSSFPLFAMSGGGKTVFNLHKSDETVKFIKIHPFTGNVVDPEGNVLVMDADYAFPYGIVWLDDDRLQLNVMIPKKEIEDELDFLKKRSYELQENFSDVKISYGILDTKMYQNEVRIFKIVNSEEVKKRSVISW